MPSNSNNSRTVIRARWVVPVTQPPIENGQVVIADGRIVAIENASRQQCDVDYGDAVILPGLVNAHTHLELTHMRGQVPFIESFTDWLRGIVALQTVAGAEASLAASMREGFAQSLAAGVTTLADIGCGHWTADAWRASPVNIVGFFEAIGMGPRRCVPHMRAIEKTITDCQLMQSAPLNDSMSRIFGISPHAPYSTAPEVYQQAIDYVRSHGLPICTHLAETRDEIEFLSLGTGPFRELLEQRGLWDGSFTPPGCSPVEYAARLGLLDRRPLLAHVNYADEADIALLARSGTSVAYCPRTHQFFRHEPHPFRRMLDRGVNVCLGTDSLASTDSLSILDEIRFLRQADPKLPKDILLQMATIRGARALGLEAQIGSIEPGKRADLVVVPLNEPAATNPMTDLLAGASTPAAVYVAGQRTFQRS